VDTLFFSTCLLEAAPSLVDGKLSFTNFIIKVSLPPHKALFIEDKVKVHPRTESEGPWRGRGVQF